MAGWRGLSAMAAEALSKAPAVLPSDQRLAAAALALRAWPGAPEAAVNVAALALSMRAHLIVHRLSAGAVALVHGTDLHSLPGEPPRLLRGPWIVEARGPEREALFGDTPSLGGYVLDGVLYLVGLRYPDGAMVAPWRPRWEERDLRAGMPAAVDSPLIDDLGAHNAWAREAARFALVLGLLLDAEGTPVAAEDERPRRLRGGGTGRRPEWTVRRVYLDRPRGGSARDEGDDAPTDAPDRRPDLRAEQVSVRGHLKRQAYGPGRSERRWVYVRGYEARRWVAPRTVVDVRTTKDR